MKRVISFFALVVLNLGVLSAQEKITVYCFKGPSGVGLIRMLDAPPKRVGIEVSVEALGSADLLIARFISGEAKIGILPPNVAAKLAASGKPLAVVAVVGNGMLSLLSSDPNIRSVSDLKDKEVYVAGQSSTPDYVFKKILTSNNIDPEKQISLRYSMAYPEMAQALIAGKISIAVLPEPFASMALKGKPTLSTPIDIQAEWAKTGSGSTYPITVLVVDTRFASSHQEALRAIIDAYRASIEWTVAHPKEAGELVEKHDLGLKAKAAEMAIPKSAYVFVLAQEARKDLDTLYSVLLSFAPGSIGGKMPNDTFYWKP
ncbi:MAG: ABC transporter substrate-binding protein [Treponemataceae bacterium]